MAMVRIVDVQYGQFAHLEISKCVKMFKIVKHLQDWLKLCKLFFLYILKPANNSTPHSPPIPF